MTTSGRTKICPDCAEEVKAPARICRFCGFHFDGSPEIEHEVGDSDHGAFQAVPPASDDARRQAVTHRSPSAAMFKSITPVSDWSALSVARKGLVVLGTLIVLVVGWAVFYHEVL